MAGEVLGEAYAYHSTSVLSVSTDVSCSEAINLQQLFLTINAQLAKGVVDHRLQF